MTTVHKVPWQRRWRLLVWPLGALFALLALFVGYRLLANATHGGFFQALSVPARSMETALLQGDYLLVATLAYRSRMPQRFDIVAFAQPRNPAETVLKRIIALPGEWVDVRGLQVYIQGHLLHEPAQSRYTFLPGREEDFGPVRVPKRGDRIELRADAQLYINDEPVPVPTMTYYPGDHGVAEARFETLYRPLLPPGTPWRQPWGPYAVQDDYYFVLGDNRAYSTDSRHWGFVPSKHLLGQASRIYWSWDRAARAVRWGRLGQVIQ